MPRRTCKVGLIEDARGTTALHSSIRKGKWRALQRLLDALLAGRFGLAPRTTALVMECFESMANKYPREFLYLVTRMPLEPEPEVLASATLASHEIMLPRRLVAGSHSRCPRGLWESKIDQFRVARLETGLQEEAEEARSRSGSASIVHRALHRSNSKRHLSGREAIGDHGERSSGASGEGSSPESCSQRKQSLDNQRKQSVESIATGSEPVIAEGYPKSTNSSLNAMRVVSRSEIAGAAVG